MARFDALPLEQVFGAILVIRPLPVDNNLLTNLVAGLSGVLAFLLLDTSALGFIPQTVILVLAGSGVSIDPAVRIGLSMERFIGSGALGYALYGRACKQQRHVTDAVANANQLGLALGTGPLGIGCLPK